MCETMCPSKQEKLTQVDPALVKCLVFAGLCSIASGLAVLTAGGDYKPTPTKCLLNVGTAVLASIHSALVSTSRWWESVHIQRGALLQTAKWKYLLISQVCIYSILEGL